MFKPINKELETEGHSLFFTAWLNGVDKAEGAATISFIKMLLLPT